MKSEQEIRNMLDNLKSIYVFKGLSDNFKDELYVIGQALEWVLADTEEADE